MSPGDVTPEGCLQTLTVAQLSDQRPVRSVPPTRQLDIQLPAAAPYVDQAAFPALHSSSHEGIGGIPGTNDFPLGTTEGFEAFKKPDANTVVPRSVMGKTETASTTTTAESTPSPVVTMAVVTTATTTTPAPSSPSVTRKQQLKTSRKSL